MPRIFRNERGFTLVELLVALTIFAVGLLSIAGMQITAIRTNSSANMLSARTALAEGIMEEILSWDMGDPRFVDSTGTSWDFDPATAGIQPNSSIQGLTGLSATYDFTLNYQGVPNVTRVLVVVTGAGRSVTLVGFKRMV